VVVHVDGAPVYAPVAGTGYQRVVNTRALLFRDGSGRHVLRLGEAWLVAPGLAGPWRAAQPSPAVPAVHVATAPTELIVTEGAPDWAPVGGATQLLYVKNTTGHVFKHLRDQATYVLVSGRWFRGPSLDGPWTFVAARAMPSDFTRIPDQSPKENVKASVPGTPQAEEALIANGIPQTARVHRKSARLTFPQYDGEPQLRPIEGTTLQYVANTSTPIIRVDARSYYAVENGVWFTSGFLAGPWRVAVSVPSAIYSIPPSSPLHFVTYVRVYDATPDVVYVGYTPGYQGTVVSGGVVVYGTGYVYTPWVGTVWYAAPVTYGYGLSVTYTPWTGWTYGAGHGWPTATAVGRTGAGYNAWAGNAWAAQAGASYNSRTGVAAAGQRGAVQNVYTGNYAAGERGVVQGPNGATAAGGRVTAGNAYSGQSVTAGRGVVYDPVTGSAASAAGVYGPNAGVGRVGSDVYAGRDGNVYRHGAEGWQQYSNGSWQSMADPGRARSLDQWRSARGTGEGRFQQFRQSDGARSGSRPAGGSRPRPRR
jgi:hypothetical protein